jgi:hypothetical protein
MVSGETEFATRFENPVGGLEERGLDEAVFVVAPLGPGIGEHDVEDIDRSRGAHPVDEVARFEPENAEVGEIPGEGAPGDLAGPAEEPFDRDEMVVGPLGGGSENITAVARAKIDFDRSGGAEFGRPIKHMEGVLVVEPWEPGAVEHGLFLFRG